MTFFSKDQLFLYLLPEYVKNLPKRNYIVWILTIYKYWRAADKKKRREFAVAFFAMPWRHIAMTIHILKTLFENIL